MPVFKCFFSTSNAIQWKVLAKQDHFCCYFIRPFSTLLTLLLLKTFHIKLLQIPSSLLYYILMFLNCLSLPAYDGEHCYEPYLPHGNFSSSDITFPLGTVVTFSCSPGFIMEQGSGVMECVDPSEPHWNESEPVCKGITSNIYLSVHHCNTAWDVHGFYNCINS